MIPGATLPILPQTFHEFSVEQAGQTIPPCLFAYTTGKTHIESESITLYKIYPFLQPAK